MDPGISSCLHISGSQEVIAFYYGLKFPPVFICLNLFTGVAKLRGEAFN